MTSQTYVRSSGKTVRYFRVVERDGDKTLVITGKTDVLDPDSKFWVADAVRMGKGDRAFRTAIDNSQVCKWLRQWRDTCRRGKFQNERFVDVQGAILKLKQEG